jgi:hypothetical protein
MKKIFEFIKKPYTTTILCVVGLTSGFFIGVAINDLFQLQNSYNQKKIACKDSFAVMCVQVHACTGNPVSDCDSFVEEQQMCNVNLPDLQTIYRCKEELRDIECEDNMPTSCSLFME